MGNQKLVSVVSPCYNVAEHLPRYFSDLIAQTYKKLEIVLVNDGATDNTPELIEAWKPKLEAEGYIVKVITQPNGGVCAAVDAGLKQFTGEYLLWPDPDDSLDPDAIEKRVAFLEANPQYGYMRSECRLIDAASGKQDGCIFADSNFGKFTGEWLFEEFLEQRVLPYPIAYTIRTSAFLEVIPDRSIHVNRVAGQNFQILAPMAWKYPCAYIEEPDCSYYRYENSHSRIRKTLKSRIEMSENGLECMIETLKRIPLDFEKYAAIARRREVERRFSIAFRSKHLPTAWRAWKEMRRLKCAKFKHFYKLLFLIILFPISLKDR